MKPVLNLALLTLILMLGSFSFSSQASDYQKLTKDYVNFLNTQHPELELWAHSRGFQAYQELEILDLELERSANQPGQGFNIPKLSLKELSCSKIVCGGGGDSCPTCYQRVLDPKANW